MKSVSDGNLFVRECLFNVTEFGGPLAFAFSVTLVFIPS